MSENPEPGRGRGRGRGRGGGRRGSVGRGGSNASRRPSRDDIQQTTPLNFAAIIDRYQATIPCERCGDHYHDLLHCTRIQPRLPTWLWQKIMEINVTAEANAHITSLQRRSIPASYQSPPANTGSTGASIQPITHSAFGTQGGGAHRDTSGLQIPGSTNTLNAGSSNFANNAQSWRSNSSPNNFGQDTFVSGQNTFGGGFGTGQRGGGRGRGRGGGRGNGRGNGRGGYQGNSTSTTSRTETATFTGALSYPAPRILNPDDTTPHGEGRQWKLPDVVKHAGEALSAMESPTYPIRQEFIELRPESTVLTNHFEYSVPTDVFYEYKIGGIGSKDKRRTKIVYQQAIESWDFLKSHKSKFATNNFDSIVAWENLHQHISEESIGGDKDSTNRWEMSLQDGNSTLSLRFELVRKIDTKALQQYSNAVPEHEKENFDIISRCLNLVISKTFDETRLYRHAANKFFVKDARSELSSNNVASISLEIVRGYYFTVKPGTGCLMLNFNLATSAFYKPILVSTFLKDKNTFGAHGEDNLKGLRVYVETERQKIPGEEADYERLNSESSRTKRVNFIGSPIGELTFEKRVKNADGKFAKNADGSYKKAGGSIKVLDYLRDTFGHSADPKLAAINCGTEKDPIWYAQEQLSILPWQIYRRPVPEKFTSQMVKEAARDPDTSRAFIEKEGLSNLGFDQQSATDGEFENIGNRDDVPIQLVPSMMQVPCQILDYPSPCYKNPDGGNDLVTLEANRGSRWKVPQNSAFFSTKPKPFKFGFLHVMRDEKVERVNARGLKYLCDAKPQDELATEEKSVTTYSNEFKRQLTRCGLGTSEIDMQPAIVLQDFEQGRLETALQTAKGNGYDLVVLMLQKPSVSTYSLFKTLAERTFGLQSACLVSKDWPGKHYLFQEYITNVMMKVNLKLGGFTHSVESVWKYLEQDDIMVLGADVVHAGPSAFSGCPSIASIVGSVDYSAGRCLGSARLQRIEKETKDDKGKATYEQITDREIIQDVEAMVTERLEDWVRLSEKKSLPKNILYFRDGVSATQYEKVKSKELEAIREAYHKLARERGTDPEVSITAVVVTKRHHTRFFPMSKKEPEPVTGQYQENVGHQKKKPPKKEYADRDTFGNYNTKPGLFVDQLVTSPYYQDFFLQSHSAIKGTAKPTHYFVLEAGIENMNLEKLRDLTHAICFSYVRGTVGVSYASPTYYSDRLCERARTYMRRYFVRTEDVKGADSLDAALISEKQRLKDHFNRRLDMLYPKGTIFTDKGEEKKFLKDKKATMADHRNEIVLGMRRYVFNKVEADFYKFKDRTVDGKPWLNPWDPVLRDTMFWM